MGLLRAALAMLVLAGSSALAWAQDPAVLTGKPSHAQIKTWLHGSDRQRAWAAWYILQGKEKSFAPELIAQAERWPPPPSVPDEYSADAQKLAGNAYRNQQDAMKAILDAVIQMHLELPVRSIHQFAQDFPSQAILLLARKPWQEAEPVLLAMYDQRLPDPPTMPDGSKLRANYPIPPVGDLLALHPPDGFALRLYRSLVLNERIDVQITKDPESIVLSQCMACMVDYRVFQVAQKGWPPVMQYELRDMRSTCPVDSQVVGGPRPIASYRFVETQAYPRANECWGLGWNPDWGSVGLLAQLLGVPPSDLPLPLYMDKHDQLRIDNATQFEDRVRELAAAGERIFTDVETIMIARGAAQPGDFADGSQRAKIALLLIDSRQVKEFPLPEIQFRDGNVQWQEEYWRTK